MFSLELSRRSLIALMATIGFVSHSVVGIAAGPLVGQPDALTRSKEAELKRVLFAMREAIDQYYVDKARYPKNLTTLDAEGYLPKIPTDPLTHSNNSWRTIPSKPTARGQRQATGIYDVKSGSK